MQRITTRLNQGHDYAEQIDATSRGVRIVDYLVSRHTHSDRATWEARVVRGEVLVDGFAASGGATLNGGERLVWRRPPWIEPDVPTGFAIIHRDDDLLAVAKPRGLPTLPGGGMFQDHTLICQVRRRCPEASPVHRLGAGTSGIVLFARNAAAARALSKQFADHTITRIYRGLASGTLPRAMFTIDEPIGVVPHPRLGSIHAATSDGKRAQSDVNPLEPRDGSTLVELTIGTGRTHQIRIHLAAAGHPLMGDPLYGIGGRPIPGSDAVPTDGGFWLHAMRLIFRHPRDDVRVELELTPPPILRTTSESSRADGDG